MRLPFLRDKRQPQPGDDAGVQAARTAARRRLVGALVLLLVGVVGFPLLFETQPRPLPAGTPIYLPEGTPARVATPAPARPAVVVPPDAGTEAVVTASAAASAPPSVAPTQAPPVQPPAPAAMASRPVASPTPAVTAAPAPKAASAPTPAAATGRFVVQVGAYNDSERMKAARQKVEKLGFKSYTQDVDTADGKRTRVRAGPFTTRQEADAAAGKLKAAGLQANVLSL